MIQLVSLSIYVWVGVLCSMRSAVRYHLARDALQLVQCGANDLGPALQAAQDCRLLGVVQRGGGRPSSRRLDHEPDTELAAEGHAMLRSVGKLRQSRTETAGLESSVDGVKEEGDGLEEEGRGRREQQQEEEQDQQQEQAGGEGAEVSKGQRRAHGVRAERDARKLVHVGLDLRREVVQLVVPAPDPALPQEALRDRVVRDLNRPTMLL